MTQDGSGQLVVAEVALEAELFVGFDGVGAPILELIGAEFIHESDAAALLKLVDDQASASGANFGQCNFELGPAVAAQAMENVAGEALGMDAHERRGIALNVAHYQRDGFFDVHTCVAFESEDPKRAVLGGEVSLSDLAQLEIFVWNNFIIMNGQAKNAARSNCGEERDCRRVSGRVG